MARAEHLASEQASDLPDERLAGAAQRDERHVVRELVLPSRVAHGVRDLPRRVLEHPPRRLLGRRPETSGERREREQRRLLRALRVRIVGDETERVRRTRRRQREAAVRRATNAYCLGIARARRDELELRVAQLGGICEARVGQARDVRAPRPDLGDLPPPACARCCRRQPRRPSCRSRGCTSAGPSREVSAAPAARPSRPRRSSSFRRTRSRSRRGRRAGGARPRRLRPGRSRRSATAGAGTRRRSSRRRRRAARAAAREVGARERVLDVRGRPLDDREDARVDRRAHGAGLEPVGPGELVPGADGQPAGACTLRDGSSCDGSSTANAPLTAIAVQPAHASRSSAASRSPFEPRSRRGFVLGLERASCRESDRPTLVRLRARRRSAAPPSPTTPTRATSPSSSAFIAWVVENATNSTRPRSSPSARAGRRACVRFRRRRLPQRRASSARRARAQLERRRIHRDGLRERPADVDPDAEPAVHALAASSARRRSGSHANM